MLIHTSMPTHLEWHSSLIVWIFGCYHVLSVHILEEYFHLVSNSFAGNSYNSRIYFFWILKTNEIVCLLWIYWNYFIHESWTTANIGKTLWYLCSHIFFLLFQNFDKLETEINADFYYLPNYWKTLNVPS